MKKLTTAALSLSLMGLTLSLPVPALAGITKNVSTSQAKKISANATYLFVLRADKGIITQTAAGYELTLQGVDKTLIYFTDRPVRAAGLEATSKFMSDWVQGTHDSRNDPPNAVITHNAIKGQEIAVTMKNPAKIGDNSWKYTLIALNGKIVPGEYEGVNLFIDSTYNNDNTSSVSDVTNSSLATTVDGTKIYSLKFAPTYVKVNINEPGNKKRKSPF